MVLTMSSKSIFYPFFSRVLLLSILARLRFVSLLQMYHDSWLHSVMAYFSLSTNRVVGNVNTWVITYPYRIYWGWMKGTKKKTTSKDVTTERIFENLHSPLPPSIRDIFTDFSYFQENKTSHYEGFITGNTTAPSSSNWMKKESKKRKWKRVKNASTSENISSYVGYVLLFHLTCDGTSTGTSRYVQVYDTR